MDQPRESEYYTVPEASSILNVSTSTVWRWIKTGRLTAYRVGPKNIRIRKADLGAVVKPARTERADRVKERDDIWARYDPEKVREAIGKSAGGWADLDAETL